ncbi:MAG: GNAT family N-acetyltransferase [Bryobacterales bacterium]|nr:GNAT family N-acetyltransferase [Bryobacterales bacterium]
MPRVSVQKLSWREWSEFAPIWERIHNLCPDASFFLSRDWVDCWLATFGSVLSPDLLTFVRDGAVVGCCLLVWRTQWIRGVPLRRVYLNCAGEDEGDSTCIEYNSLLSLPDCAQEVAEALGAFLRSSRWDELILHGMTDSVVSVAVRSLGTAEASVRPAHYVELWRLRGEGIDFDSALPAKTRKNIRRSYRAYDGGGPYAVRFARSTEEAIVMLRELAKLHQASWTERGRPGVFASHRFAAFHEALVRGAFDKGQILVCQVCNGAESTVGMLYCFLDRGCVRFYQSGFNYGLEGKESPGLLTLYLIISHFLDHADYSAFDFLAGDSQYKRSLASANRPLSWIIVRRSTIPTLSFRALRWMKRQYVQVIKKSRRKSQPDGRRECSADVFIPNVEAGSGTGGRGG